MKWFPFPPHLKSLDLSRIQTLVGSGHLSELTTSASPGLRAHTSFPAAPQPRSPENKQCFFFYFVLFYLLLFLFWLFKVSLWFFFLLLFFSFFFFFFPFLFSFFNLLFLRLLFSFLIYYVFVVAATARVQKSKWQMPAIGPASWQKSPSTHSPQGGPHTQDHSSNFRKSCRSVQSIETNTECQAKWRDRGIFSKRKNQKKKLRKRTKWNRDKQYASCRI